MIKIVLSTPKYYGPSKFLSKACLLIIWLFAIDSGLIAQEFEIRGVLPWHNFLEGPTSWNEEDYELYLDKCQEEKINFVAFHNYTGGAERYLNYVEPMIKVQYKNILPVAGFDHSGTARWGYLPLAVKEFPYGTSSKFHLPEGAEYFGSDAAVLPKNNEERYQQSQKLMNRVMKMVHERGMQMAMGFEFGVAPLEYASIRTNYDMYWLGKGSLIYNPFDADATGILYASIDNILETYEGIDWVYLWLNELCMLGLDTIQALENPLMSAHYKQYSGFFGDEQTNQDTKFLGVWAHAYIQKAYNYIKQKSPNTKVVIGGWGAEEQMASLLEGLHRTLPKNITFSMLNPDQGSLPHPEFFRTIAKDRAIWSIPWLEGDQSLWHVQLRVDKMKNQVKKAHEDGLDGVVGIHWRTDAIEENFLSFANQASNPLANETTKNSYKRYFSQKYGEKASSILAPVIADFDTTGMFNGIQSPVYFAFTPSWGRLTTEQRDACKLVIDLVDNCLKKEENERLVVNLNRMKSQYQFMLLFEQVCEQIEPAWELRNKSFNELSEVRYSQTEIERAKIAFDHAPMKELIFALSTSIGSRGDLGFLSDVIQRVYQEHSFLRTFLNGQN